MHINLDYIQQSANEINTKDSETHLQHTNKIYIPEDIILNFKEYKENIGATSDKNDNDILCELAKQQSNTENKSYENTLSTDGKIDGTQQGNLGDCWLLSGVNALSYTEKGREVIKNALQYDENGVNVKFITGEYYISYEEINKAKASNTYSSGDDDMLVLELATKLAREDETYHHNVKYIYNDKVEGTYTFDENGNKIPEVMLNGGQTAEIIYLLTGKDSINSENFSGDKEELLNQFEQNQGKDIVLSGGIDLSIKDIIVEDINGQEIELDSTHAYAIKKVEGNSVTVIDPHDATKEIILPRETFKNVMSRVYMTDLSDSNPTIEPIKAEISTTEDGLISKKFRNKNGIVMNEYFHDPKTDKCLGKAYTVMVTPEMKNSCQEGAEYYTNTTMYQTDGETMKEFYLEEFDENQNLIYSEKYYYNSKGEATRIEYDYDGDGIADKVEKRWWVWPW